MRTKPSESSATVVLSQEVSGSAPMKQNNPPQAHRPGGLGGSVLERHLLEVPLAGQGPHLGLRQYLDAGIRLDAFDQIPRHGLGEVVPADGDQDLAPLLGHVDGGLPCRVPSTHDDDVPAAADPRFEVGGRVVDPGTLEALQIVDRQPAIAGPGGHDHRPTGDLAPVGQCDDVKPVFGSKSGGHAGGVEARPEALGLDRSARHELLSRDPVGEAGVVLDARAGAGLATDGDGVEGDRVEAFRRAVHGGGQAGGAACRRPRGRRGCRARVGT